MIVLKTIQQLLLPGSLALVLMVVGLILWLFSRKKKLGRILLILGILVYYLFSTAVVSNFLLASLEDEYSFLAEQDIVLADKAVLLLGGRESDVLRGSEVLRLSHLKDHELKIIISGTDPLLPSSQEALGLKQFFVSRGIPEQNIVIEGSSRNTWENIRNVKEIVDQKPFFLVTSAYHIERALREFEKMEANPIPAPTDFKRKSEKYNFLDFLPNSQNLRNSSLAIHEYLGILWYKIRL